MYDLGFRAQGADEKSKYEGPILRIHLFDDHVWSFCVL